jgi:hypothetical protein
MLRSMTLVEQWERIQAVLPDDWAEAQLALRVTDGDAAARAAALIAPLTPGRREHEFRFAAVRRGSASSPLAVSRALARLDGAGIAAELELVYADAAAAEARGALPGAVADAWEMALAELPANWSDVYVELELTSTDHLEPAAIALSPVNPARAGTAASFRFRCARQFGYGASPVMVRRCLERLDEREIPAAVDVLWVLSDTHPVGTQGPVWYVGGKVV